jgi:hypothetical protein
MTAIAQFEKDFTQNVIGYSAIGIILSTCLGSFAIYGIFTSGSGMIQAVLTFLVVALCSIHNAAILTVQKPKLILQLLILSSVVNFLIIIGSLFQ